MAELVRRADACVLLVDLGDGRAPNFISYILDSLESRDVILAGTVPTEREGFEVYIPTLLAGNKDELPGAAEVFVELEAAYGDRFRIQALSVQRDSGLGEFKQALFDVLQIDRIFTKAPGKEPDLGKPFILARGSTVRDLAGKIHKDFLKTLRYARLWGSSGRFEGQRVGEEHVLEDGDIVELHTR